MPSLTSGAAPVAEELQEESSKFTRDEMANTVTEGNGIGLWPVASHYIGWKMKQARFDIAIKSNFLTMAFRNTEKKLVTEMQHNSYSSPEPQRRSGW